MGMMHANCQNGVEGRSAGRAGAGPVGGGGCASGRRRGGERRQGVERRARRRAGHAWMRNATIAWQRRRRRRAGGPIRSRTFGADCLVGMLCHALLTLTVGREGLFPSAPCALRHFALCCLLAAEPPQPFPFPPTLPPTPHHGPQGASCVPARSPPLLAAPVWRAVFEQLLEGAQQRSRGMHRPFQAWLGTSSCQQQSCARGSLGLPRAALTAQTAANSKWVLQQLRGAQQSGRRPHGRQDLMSPAVAACFSVGCRQARCGQEARRQEAGCEEGCRGQEGRSAQGQPSSGGGGGCCHLTSAWPTRAAAGRPCPLLTCPTLLPAGQEDHSHQEGGCPQGKRQQRGPPPSRQRPRRPVRTTTARRLARPHPLQPPACPLPSCRPSPRQRSLPPRYACARETEGAAVLRLL